MANTDPTKEQRESNILRIRQAAAYLGITNKTLYSWVKDGRLPEPIRLSPRVVGWKKSDLDSFIESCKQAE